MSNINYFRTKIMYANSSMWSRYIRLPFLLNIFCYFSNKILHWCSFWEYRWKLIKFSRRKWFLMKWSLNFKVENNWIFHLFQKVNKISKTNTILAGEKLPWGPYGPKKAFYCPWKRMKTLECPINFQPSLLLKGPQHFCGRTFIYGVITLINCVKTVDPSLKQKRKC